MSNLPAEMLQDYVKRMLENEETVKGLFARVVENKIAAWMKENITLEEIVITSGEFSKLTAAENQQFEEAEAEEEVEEEKESEEENK